MVDKIVSDPIHFFLISSAFHDDNMCLYNFLPCPAHQPGELLRILKNPTRDVVVAGLVRCKWYEAIAGASTDQKVESPENKDADFSRRSSDLQTNRRRVKFHDNKDVCPYVVIRHDEELLLAEEVQRFTEAVLLRGISHYERGCSDCRDMVFSRQWMGRSPTEAEKMHYLYTTTTATTTTTSHGTGASSGLKRRRSDEDLVNLVEKLSEEGYNEEEGSDDDLSFISERPSKRARIESIDSLLPDPVSTSKPELAKPAATTSIPAVGEVMPPPLWKVKKSESESYAVVPTGDGRNWNHSNDKMFQVFLGTQKEKSFEKRRSTSRFEKEGPLQTSRNRMESEIDTNLRSQRSASEFVNPTILASGPSIRSQWMNFEASKDSAGSTSSKRENCENCGRRFIVLSGGKVGSRGRLLCFQCSPGSEESRDANETRADHRGRCESAPAVNSLDPLLTSTLGLQARTAHSLGASRSKQMREGKFHMKRQGPSSNVEGEEAAVNDDEPGEGELTDNDFDAVGSNDSSIFSSEVSASSTSSTSNHEDLRGFGYKGNETETLRHIVVHLRRENAKLDTKLRNRTATMLEQKAKAAQREAKLLRKLSGYEASEEDEAGEQPRKVGDRWVCAQGHYHRQRERAINCEMEDF